MRSRRASKLVSVPHAIASISSWGNAGWGRRARSRTHTTSSVQTPGAGDDFLGCALLRTGVRSLEKCAKFMLPLSHLPQCSPLAKLCCCARLELKNCEVSQLQVIYAVVVQFLNKVVDVPVVCNVRRYGPDSAEKCLEWFYCCEHAATSSSSPKVQRSSQGSRARVVHVRRYGPDSAEYCLEVARSTMARGGADTGSFTPRCQASCCCICQWLVLHAFRIVRVWTDTYVNVASKTTTNNQQQPTNQPTNQHNKQQQPTNNQPTTNQQPTNQPTTNQPTNQQPFLLNLPFWLKPFSSPLLVVCGVGCVPWLRHVY